MLFGIVWPGGTLAPEELLCPARDELNQPSGSSSVASQAQEDWMEAQMKTMLGERSEPGRTGCEHERAVAVLIENLVSPSGSIDIQVTNSLIDIGGPQISDATPKYVDALNRPDQPASGHTTPLVLIYNHQVAIRALGSFGDASAIPAVEEYLVRLPVGEYQETPWSRVDKVAGALAAIVSRNFNQQEGGHQLVIRYLSHENPKLRLVGYQVLSAMSPEQRLLYRKNMSSEKWIRQLTRDLESTIIELRVFASRELGALGADAREAVPKLIDASKARVEQKSIGFQRSFSGTLGTQGYHYTRDINQRGRDAAIRALAAIREPYGLIELFWLAELRSLSVTSLNMMKSIGERIAPKAVPIIVSSLKLEKYDKGLVIDTLEALGEESKRAIPYFAERFLSSDPGFSRYELDALARLGKYDPGAIAALWRDTLESDRMNFSNRPHKEVLENVIETELRGEIVEYLIRKLVEKLEIVNFWKTTKNTLNYWKV